MNIFELIFFSLLLWLICMLTIWIHEVSPLPAWLVSFMVPFIVLSGIMIVAATVQRMRKPTDSDAKED